MVAENEQNVEREQLVAETVGLRRQVEELTRRLAELEAFVKKLGGRSPATPTQRLDQAYSLKAEEQRRVVIDASTRSNAS